MTRVLIDVTSKHGRFALGHHDEVEIYNLKGPKHAESLIPELQLSLGMRPKVKAVGVITGPGSFTGIRIGIATAQGLARGWQVPLFSSNLFDLLQGEAPDNAEIWVPAGRNRFFCLSQGVISHVDASEIHNADNSYGFGQGPFHQLPDPLETLDRKIVGAELQPNPVPVAFYAKDPDAKKGTSLLEKLRLKGHHF